MNPTHPVGFGMLAEPLARLFWESKAYGFDLLLIVHSVYEP